MISVDDLYKIEDPSELYRLATRALDEQRNIIDQLSRR